MCTVGSGCLHVRLVVAVGGCLLGALSVPSGGQAQEAGPEFVTRTWDRRDGLPAAGINEIQRAPNGYLWLATQRGLLRFDGERFKAFDTESHAEFRTNWMAGVLADSSGGVWLGTPAGLFYQPDGKPGRDKWIEVGAHLPVKALASGGGGAIWALSVSNEVVQIAGGSLTARFKAPGDKPAHLLLCDKQNGLLVASTHGAALRREERWLSVPPELIAKVRPDLACRSEQGGFWMAADREVVRLVEKKGQFTVTRLESTGDGPRSTITALMEDHLGRLWAGTREGAVYCLEPIPGSGAPDKGAGPAWRQVTPKRLASLGNIACVYEDSEGLVWAGTTAGYLHQIKRRLVETWSLPSITQESVPHTVCVARDGAVWVGTDGAGVFRYQHGNVTRFGMEQGLGNGTVISMLEDTQTNLWLGTFGGLYRFENGRFKAELGAFLDNQPVPALFQDRAGTLWFGSTGAVLRKRGEEVNEFLLPRVFQRREVRAMAEAPRGALWIGTRGGGLFRLEEGKVEKYAKFSAARVHTMYSDARGNLWVGTATRGLFRVAGNRINSWSRSDGLPNSWIHSILEDSSGTLWLGSNEGIFGVTKQALLGRARSKQSPLLTIQVASSEMENWSAGSGQPSAAKGPDGRLWFPAGHGVLSFQPAELMRQRPALPVLIEEVRVDGAERVFNQNGPLQIFTGMKRLEFRYTVADLDSPGRLKFRYKLEGLDERWVDGGAQRSATYGPLAPGTYQFRVISAGSGNETATPLSIQIVPHLWQTTSFQVGLAVLSLGAVGATALFIGRAKLRRKLERLELQHALEKERQRIAQDLHDDVGSGISEIVFLSELARQEQTESPARTPEQLANITQKARQIATAMDEVVWTVNPKNDSLPNLASYLCDYAREFLRAANVGCRLDMAERLPNAPLTAQQRHNLFMVVKEALNNAVKHSGAGEVWLRILWSDAVVVVSVEDNGRGFHPAQAQAGESGNGLANMQARLEAIGGKTEYSSQPGQGTRVRFTLPLVAVTPTASADSLN